MHVHGKICVIGFSYFLSFVFAFTLLHTLESSAQTEIHIWGDLFTSALCLILTKICECSGVLRRRGSACARQPRAHSDSEIRLKAKVCLCLLLQTRRVSHRRSFRGNWGDRDIFKFAFMGKFLQLYRFVTYYHDFRPTNPIGWPQPSTRLAQQHRLRPLLRLRLRRVEAGWGLAYRLDPIGWPQQGLRHVEACLLRLASTLLDL